MNDFTKEELTYIRNYIFKGAAAIGMREHDLLHDKIQSMIDNYCEHDWNETMSEREYFRCLKCGDEQ